MSIRTVIAVLALAMAANATELSIEHGVLAPGKPVSLDVKISAGTDKATGIQFDLQYDAVALDMTIDAGPAAVQAGKSLRAAKIEPGRQRVLIVGFNKNVISDGVLAILHVSYKGRQTGKTFSIHIVGAAGTNEKAQPLPVTGNDGSINSSTLVMIRRSSPSRSRLAAPLSRLPKSFPQPPCQPLITLSPAVRCSRPVSASSSPVWA